MEKRNLAILFGGKSPEYSVSLQSAGAVLAQLDREKYRPIPIGISPQGEWFYYTGSVESIASDTWCNARDCRAAVVPPGVSRELLVFAGGSVEKIRLDAAFPILHGQNGEDGTVQGLLALADIPLVGCGVLSSALCMDKVRAHRLVQAAGILAPVSHVLETGWQQRQALNWARQLGYPLFVKPVKAGSSYGVSRVRCQEQLFAAIGRAFAYDDQVIMEQSIDGFEVGCAILGNDELTLGAVDEIELSGGFFDYTEKYTLKSSAIHVPARISESQTRQVQMTAARIYRILDCRGFARVDLFLDKKGQIFFNEVNTIPGFTAHSRYPSMMRAAGLDFAQVLERLIALAVEP